MIDVQARSKLAEASRWLASGLISNHEYDDRVLHDLRLPTSRDPAIREIYSKGFWPMYDDMRRYRLKGRHRLSRQARSAAARYVLFLESGAAYDWPALSRPASLVLAVLNLATLGFAGLAYAAHAKRGRDIAYWPFTSRVQHDAALQSPVYLSGRRN